MLLRGFLGSDLKFDDFDSTGGRSNGSNVTNNLRPKGFDSQ